MNYFFKCDNGIINFHMNEETTRFSFERKETNTDIETTAVQELPDKELREIAGLILDTMKINQAIKGMSIWIQPQQENEAENLLMNKESFKLTKNYVKEKGRETVLEDKNENRIVSMYFPSIRTQHTVRNGKYWFKDEGKNNDEVSILWLNNIKLWLKIEEILNKPLELLNIIEE